MRGGRCHDKRPGLRGVAQGRRPTSSGRHRFQSLYVYGFARPATGRNLCLFLPKANAELMGEALAEFARWADPESKRVLVLLVDNAGGHVAKALKVPANVRLYPLPPCTPELQPAEHLWPLTNAALVNQHFASIDELEDAQFTRCAALQRQRECIRSTTLFHWWPKQIHKRRGPRRN